MAKLKKIGKISKEQKAIFILLGVILASGIVIVLLSTINPNDKPKKVEETSSIPKQVLNLYDGIHNVNCQKSMVWNIEEDTLSLNKLSETEILNLIFRKIELNDKLESNLKYDDYVNAAVELFGRNFEFPTTISNFAYKSFIYDLKDQSFIVQGNICNNDKEYIEHLYGYSEKTGKLTLDVNVGYVKENKIYDLEDKEVGSYDEDTYQNELTKATAYRYTFENNNGTYQLYTIEKIKKVTN